MRAEKAEVLGKSSHIGVGKAGVLGKLSHIQQKERKAISCLGSNPHSTQLLDDE